MKKIFAVIALTLSFTAFSYADSKNNEGNNEEASVSSMVIPQNTIFGQVVESDSYSPLNCAIITINSSSDQPVKRMTSNGNGLFEISGIPAGNYKMTVSFPGCNDVNMNVKVSHSSTDMGVIEIK